MTTATTYAPESAAKLRPIKCRACGGLFSRVRPMQVACSLPCSIRVAQDRRAKQERKDHAARKLAAKPRSRLLAEAQAEFNRYIRLRDTGRPCISCGRDAHWGGQWHASHLRSVGAASALRFHLWNVWRACSICNHHLSGNVAEYERRLRTFIGDARVDWLRAQNKPAEFSREYLERLRRVFRKKANRLEART